MHDKDLVLMTNLAAETRAAAANIEHEWDRRAIDWPLTRDSVVVEVGGYKGRWALQIAERYNPRLYVFEPQSWAAQVCREVLGDLAEVLPFGIGVEDGYFMMGEYETDGCSFAKEPGDDYALCQMKDVSAAFTDLQFDHIDLMLVNIEGYEYTLIPHMLNQGIHPSRLMVQFHTFADPKGEQGRAIEGRLGELGYRMAWTYGEVLTAWERR
jgi:FkbM family methyltransferase